MLSSFFKPLANTSYIKSVFTVASRASLIGWIALATFPSSIYTQYIVNTSVALNSALYTLYMITAITNPAPDSKGINFSSWNGVLTLFRKGSEAGLLGAWIHYLAFDLLVGNLIAQDAVRNGVHQVIVLPFLGSTLMFGPMGIGSWILLRGLFGCNGLFL